MTKEAQQSEARARAIEGAVEWRVRFDEGRSDESDPDFRAWLAASPEHAAAMARADRVSRILDEHAAAPELVKLRRDALDQSGRAAARRWAPFGRGAARMRAAAAVFALLATGLAATAVFAPAEVDPAGVEIAQAESFETAIGETRVVTLADNSRVTLDAASRVRIRYSAGHRDITLERGQAYFDVAKDRNRPFRVTAGDQVVVATGTAFNIELVGDNVLVTLLEGEVVVSDADAKPRRLAIPGIPSVARPAVKLATGEQLVATATDEREVERDVNVEKTNAWRAGKIILDGDTLAEAVARMNRYSRITLTVEGQGLEELRISGVFNAGDTDAFIEAVEAYFPVEARRMSASSIEIHPKS